MIGSHKIAAGERSEMDRAMNRATREIPDNTMSAEQAAHWHDGHRAFADYLKRRVPTENTPELQLLSITLYKLLGRGAPVALGQLGIACGLSKEKIEKLLLEFPAAYVGFQDDGKIIACGGLSLVPTHHRFDTQEAGLYTWCVFDALFLPEILGNPATLVTHCPASGVELTVELASGEVRSASPSGCVMSIVTPDSRACCDNLRTAFCDHVNLFKDEQTFMAWSRGRRGVGSVTLQQAQMFARQRNAWRFPDVELNG
jgi:alkylmercury lyase